MIELTTDEKKVLGVLREHARQVGTIVWGVGIITRDSISVQDAKLALESLEQKGLAATFSLAQVGIWWIITQAGQEWLDAST